MIYLLLRRIVWYDFIVVFSVIALQITMLALRTHTSETI